MRDARNFLDMRPHLRACLMEGREFPQRLWDDLVTLGVPSRDLGWILAPGRDHRRRQMALRTARRLGIGVAVAARFQGHQVTGSRVDTPEGRCWVMTVPEASNMLLDVWPRRLTRLAASYADS